MVNYRCLQFPTASPRWTLVHHDDSAGSTKISDLTDLVINPSEIFTRDFAATKRVSTRPSLCVRRRYTTVPYAFPEAYANPCS
ncbi:hypothetical protein T02_6870 [Trichinella nativa]|uniref:Uncharacterized protein n=1 Tax=Trichinella nativa TaxID=6335 RepID=A0A0V1KPJ0_9BILA|nr:hypothetical protein T02_6870 [Trichinella nativa]